MMMMATIVAVALGLAPVEGSGAGQIVKGDYSTQVGQFSHFVDSRGTVHLNGRDRHGIPYELVMDKRGYVEATFGECEIHFRAQEAS